MSSNFWYQHFVAVSGNLAEKVPVVDKLLSSHEHEIQPITSLDEHCVEFEFRTDRIYYVDLRQTYVDRKLKFVEGRGCETYNSKELNEVNIEEAKVDEKTVDEEQEAPVLLVTHVNSILHSIFPNVEVYINNQQIYNSSGLYAHKFYIFNNFKGTIVEYKRLLHCHGYDYE